MQHYPTDDRGRPLSPDRQWVWNGQRWERAAQTSPPQLPRGRANAGHEGGSKLHQTSLAWRGWSAPTRFAVISSSIIVVLMLSAIVLASAQRNTPTPPPPVAAGVTPTIPFTPSEAARATPQIIATPTTTIVTPTSTPTPLAAPTQAPPAPPTVAVVGFGATDAEWNSRHRQTPGFTAGAVYDPDPSLPQVNGRVGSRYFAVIHQEGGVLSYSMALHAGTSIKEARTAVMQEFPLDAKAMWFNVKANGGLSGPCAQMAIQSRVLGTSLADPKIGDPEGYAIVEFGTDHSDGRSGYDPNNVTAAILGLGTYRTAAEAPAC
jgi:hypothetical protein